MIAPAVYGEARYGEAVYEPVRILGAGGGITMAVRVYRSTIGGQLVEELEPGLVSDGGIELNLDRAIRLTASFATRHPEKIAPYADYLAPYMTLSYEDGRLTTTVPLGIYAIRIPPGTWAPGTHTRRSMGAGLHEHEAHFVTFEGEDLTRVLADSSYTSVNSVAAGRNVIAEVEATIDQVSTAIRTTFEPSSRTTSAAQSFPVGTSRLDKINALLSSIGYYEVTMDVTGVLGSGPIKDIKQIEPFATWSTADFVRPIEEQPVDTTIANVIIVVKDNPNAAPLKAIRRNTTTDSPTSIAALGREKARVERRTDLETQADVNALADRLLAESRSYYQTAKVATLPNPDGLRPHQTVDLVLTDEMEELSGRWWVRTAKIGFRPASAALECEINRLTDTINGVVM